MKTMAIIKEANITKIINLFISICFVILTCLTSTAYATDIQIISTRGSYIMGKKDTLDDAEQSALKEAKRNAVEQAGTYIESLTVVENAQVVKDIIATLASNIISVKEKTFTQEIQNGQLVIHCDIVAEIDVDTINAQLKEQQLMLFTKEYRKLQEKNRNIEYNSNIENNLENVRQANKYINIAQQYANKDDFNNAIAAYTTALKYMPSSKEAHIMRGLAYYSLHQNELALYDLNAVEIDFSFKQAGTIYVIRALLNEEIGNIDSAISDLSNAILLNDISAYQIRAVFYARHNRYKEAIEDALTYIKRADFNIIGKEQLSKTYMLIAYCYQYSGNMQKYYEYEKLAKTNG